MIAGGVAGGAWALDPGFLRAFANTNEIITSLMLNYVAALFLNYLIFDTLSYWRDTSTPGAEQFPQGKALPDAATWPTFGLGEPRHPVRPARRGRAAPSSCLVLYTRTRFGFEAAVIGDSPRAARYAGMRTRRKILPSWGSRGARRHRRREPGRRLPPPARPARAAAAGLRLHGHRGRGARALQPVRGRARRVPARRAQNAGYALQGADFPSGLVGVMQGMILFCALGGELLVRYRVRFGRARAAEAAAAG